MFVDSDGARKKVVVRRPFTAHEDATLMLLINPEVEVDWEAVAKRMDGRSARQCRERWLNYLSPSIRADPWTDFEDRVLVAKINEMATHGPTLGTSSMAEVRMMSRTDGIRTSGTAVSSTRSLGNSSFFRASATSCFQTGRRGSECELGHNRMRFGSSRKRR